MARRMLRIGSTRNPGLWPIVLLLIVVVAAPTACVLWFMTEAMSNERLAVRQKLVDVYRGQLSVVRDVLENFWKERAEALEGIDQDAPGSAVFAYCIRSGLLDSVICYDTQGQLIYPASPPPLDRNLGGQKDAWEEANRLEHFRQDPIAAADAYQAIAKGTSNNEIAAHALQAQARCLVKAGQNDTALNVLSQIVLGDMYRQAADLQGRLIVANAELRILQLIDSPSHAYFQSTADRLKSRLLNYNDPLLPAAQRRFLMNQLQTILPGGVEFPTLEAEDLAARLLEAGPSPPKDPLLRLSEVPDIWQFASPNGRVIALFQEKNLFSLMCKVIATQALPGDVSVDLIPPTEKPLPETMLVSLPAGQHLPGWRLALSLKNGALFDSAADKQIASYLWTGILAIVVIFILAALFTWAIARQMRLARLKNDLVATVSHELKTPLSASRLLVDTLLDEQCSDRQKANEYLQLIAKENTRLSRLIDNFLTFSRMERNKHSFEFSDIRVTDVVMRAEEAVRDRFNSPGCQLSVDISPNLPTIMADENALVTVILNLLDNAYKYTASEKHVVLRAYAENGNICIEVEDNGIGLSRRAARKVFDRFYQVDQHLSRNGGGCGLGLSIVKYIVTAHRGAVRCTSQPGKGSTFTVTLPSAPVGSPSSEGASD